MKLVLCSDFPGTKKTDNGLRYACPLSNVNGFSDKLKTIWPENAKVLILASDPEAYQINDEFAKLYKESFLLSNLYVERLDVYDYRNSNDITEIIYDYNIIILAGGHVPTENAFFQRIHLRETFTTYDGIILGISAGSMNCARIVYAQPELEGEAINDSYMRFISGLALTEIRILPHFQLLKNETLDNLRIVEDISINDSKAYPFYAIVDGSYIFIDEEKQQIYGESYLFKDGSYVQITSENDVLTIEDTLS